MATLQLQLKPSKTFLIIMLFILGGALVSIYCSFLPYYIQLPLSMAALVYGRRLIWREVLLRDKRAIVALTRHADNTWLLKERSGDEWRASLCGDSTRLGFVSSLRFKSLPPKREKRSSVVFYDAVDPTAYRRMLMGLKIH